MKPIAVQPLINVYSGLGALTDADANVPEAAREPVHYRLPPRAVERVYGLFCEMQRVDHAWLGVSWKLNYPKTLPRRRSRYTVKEACQVFRPPHRPDQAVMHPQGMNLLWVVLSEFHSLGIVDKYEPYTLYYIVQFHAPGLTCFNNSFAGDRATFDMWALALNNRTGEGRFSQKVPDVPGMVGAAGFKPWYAAGVMPDELLGRGWLAEPDLVGYIAPQPDFPDLMQQGRVQAPAALTNSWLHEMKHGLGMGHTQDDPATAANEGYQSLMSLGYRYATGGYIAREREYLRGLGALV
jgi:hypothetical protein